MAYWWMPFVSPVVQAGGSLYGYLTRKKRSLPDFSSTPYGKMLRKRAVEGTYSPYAKQRILGSVAKQLGQAEQQRKAELRSQLYSKLGPSIATERVISEPTRERMRGLADITTQIETQNELSKQQAREEFAKRQYEYNILRRQQKEQALADLISGLSTATANAFMGWLKKRQIDMETFDALSEADLEELLIRVMSAKTPEERQKAVEDYMKKKQRNIGKFIYRYKETKKSKPAYTPDLSIYNYPLD